MKRIFFLILFYLQSCIIQDEKKSFDFNFSDDMTFKEFEIKLDKNEKNSQYTNINN